MKSHYLITHLNGPSHKKLYFNDIYYCYNYCADVTIISEMLQRALIKSDKAVFLPNFFLQEWLDNVYSCTRSALPK